MTSSNSAMGTQSPDASTVIKRDGEGCESDSILFVGLRLQNVATSRTLVNASTTGTYRTNHQQVRPGADQHRQHKSYGVLT